MHTYPSFLLFFHHSTPFFLPLSPNTTLPSSFLLPLLRCSGSSYTLPLSYSNHPPILTRLILHLPSLPLFHHLSFTPLSPSYHPLHFPRFLFHTYPPLSLLLLPSHFPLYPPFSLIFHHRSFPLLIVSHSPPHLVPHLPSFLLPPPTSFALDGASMGTDVARISCLQGKVRVLLI